MKVFRPFWLTVRPGRISGRRPDLCVTEALGATSIFSAVHGMDGARLVGRDRWTEPDMVSLDTTIARHRIYYPRPIPSMPDILMINIPPEFLGARSMPGRRHPILIETIAEQSEIEVYIRRDFDVPPVPDILDQRSSKLQADHVTVAHYPPPAEGWPYVLLCCWPLDLTAATPPELKMFVRGAYTIELFDDQGKLEQASDRLLALLGRRRRTRVEIVRPDWSATPGETPH